MGFDVYIEDAKLKLKDNSCRVHTEKWQGIDISKQNAMATYEILNFSFTARVWTEDRTLLAEEIKPNLPWADDHFKERVCGEPINPGVEWANWPYSHSADKFRDDNGQFNHNYMERYWPRYAGLTDQGELRETMFDPNHPEYDPSNFNRGIRQNSCLGDLNDVVNLLREQPLTRQAYLPIFFPEDTGAVNGGRMPCTLGYHFIVRQDMLHITYYLRSCDFVRHFRDDIYLTVLLQLWVLDQLRLKNPEYWGKIRPGLFTMHIVSLHLFANDYIRLFGQPPIK